MDNCDYVIDGDNFFSNPKSAMDWYKKQYYIALEENKTLQEECAALRSQLNELL